MHYSMKIYFVILELHYVHSVHHDKDWKIRKKKFYMHRYYTNIILKDELFVIRSTLGATL